MLWSVPLTCTSMRGIVYEPSAFKSVRNGGSCRQYGLSSAVSGSASRISHVSSMRRPVLVPPWNVRPPRIRAVKLTSTPFQWRR